MQPPEGYDFPPPAELPAERQPEIGERPGLPEHPEPMAADLEDEEADPVVDSGPGIADGPQSARRTQASAWPSEVPAPESVPPMNNPDPQPGDPKPKAPPADDEPGRRSVPVELPGKPGSPERV
ncbi:MAG TPA: hypothetical protein VLJ58_11995 [Ramlibacter sp.]|nr:hypothetical protein [Ramlibacter sp.]